MSCFFFFPPADEDNFGTGGITFSINSPGEGAEFGGSDTGLETGPANPNCFAWCLMNLCISKILQQVVRRMVAGVGLELMGKGSSYQISTLLVTNWKRVVTVTYHCYLEATYKHFITSCILSHRVGDCVNSALLHSQSLGRVGIHLH